MRWAVVLATILLLAEAACGADAAPAGAAPAADAGPSGGETAARDAPAPKPGTPVSESTETPAIDAVQEPPGTPGKDKLPQPEEKDLEAIGSAPVGVVVHTALPAGGRPFSFYVPKSYDKTRSYPLLVTCTGTGIGRENIRRAWHLAERFDLLVVSPDTWAIYGKPGSDVRVGETRQAWSRSGQTVDVPMIVRDQAEILRDLQADSRAIGDVVALLQKTYSIDKRLVVLTGFSGGAWVAYYAGLSDPARYAGISIRSGTFRAGALPKRIAKARAMPISVVIGDRDLDLVLKDTAKAETFFKQRQFENFQVERLPHSGHDNRPEVAGNFVDYLRGELKARERAEAMKQWEKYYAAGKAAAAHGDADKARHWLRKAADLEAAHDLPPKAAELLKTLDANPEDARKPAP